MKLFHLSVCLTPPALGHEAGPRHPSWAEQGWALPSQPNRAGPRCSKADASELGCAWAPLHRNLIQLLKYRSPRDITSTNQACHAEGRYFAQGQLFEIPR